MLQISDTQKFATISRAWLTSLMAQRKKINDNGESRRSRTATMQAIDTIGKYLSAYPNMTDEQMARFFINHFHSISLIAPGRGSKSYEQVNAKMHFLRNQAHEFLNKKTMDKYTYYHVTDGYSEGFIRTSDNGCSVITISSAGQIKIASYDEQFRNDNGQVAVKIDSEQFTSGVRRAMQLFSKQFGL